MRRDARAFALRLWREGFVPVATSRYGVCCIAVTIEMLALSWLERALG
jgi:hypothetical protein